MNKSKELLSSIKKKLFGSSSSSEPKDSKAVSSQKYTKLHDESPFSRKNPFYCSEHKMTPFSLSRDKYKTEKVMGESFFQKEKDEIEKERKEKEQKNLIDL